MFERLKEKQCDWKTENGLEGRLFEVAGLEPDRGGLCRPG